MFPFNVSDHCVISTLLKYHVFWHRQAVGYQWRDTHTHTGKLLGRVRCSRDTLHRLVLKLTHTHTHSAVARQPRPSDILLTEIVSAVLWLPFSLRMWQFTLSRGDSYPERRPPGQNRGEKSRIYGGTERERKRTRRMSSEGGEGLIKGNICKPEGSYVNGLVIKAF